MTDETYDEEAIFKIACQIASPAARVEYLHQICGDDAILFGRVANLLRVYQDESSFLESPPQGIGVTTNIPVIPEKPGTQIGPYKLLQVIGEGGMGVVYMAEQTEPVKRKVALKLIKPGMDSHQMSALGVDTRSDIYSLGVLLYELVTAALGLGTAVSVWQAFRATQAQEQAQLNFETAETQRKRAERHFRSARDAVNHMAEVGQARLSLIPRAEPVRRELLEKALEFYQTFIEEERADPTIRQEMGRDYLHVGWIHRSMENVNKAIDSYRQAVHVFEGLVAEFPDEPDYRNDFARGQATFGLLMSNQRPEAKQALSAAITIQKKLVAEYPDRLAYKKDLITSQHYYAWVLMYNTTAPDMEQAEDVLEQIQEILTKVEPKDQSPDQNTDALMGDIFFNTRRLQEAEKVWRRSLAHYQKLVIDSPANPVYRGEVAHRYENLGWLLERTDRLEEAEQSLRQSVSIRQKLALEFSDVVEYSEMLHRSLSELRELLRKTGRSGECLNLYEESMSMCQASLGPSHPRTVASLNDLAWFLATTGDAEIRNPQRAMELAEKAVELAPREGSYWNTLGIAHYRAAEWKDGIDALKKSDELVKGDMFSFNAFFLAMAHWQLDEKDEASEWYKQAVDWMEKNQPENEELERFRAEAAELLGIAENVLPVPEPAVN